MIFDVKNKAEGLKQYRYFYNLKVWIPDFMFWMMDIP